VHAALDRLPDAPFADYGLTADDVGQLRRRMQNWPRDHEQDHDGRRVHAEVHQQDRTSATGLATRLAAAAFPTPLHAALRQGTPAAELAPQPCEHPQHAGRPRTAVPAQALTHQQPQGAGTQRHRRPRGTTTWTASRFRPYGRRARARASIAHRDSPVVIVARVITADPSRRSTTARRAHARPFR
jgi:hypothetical protein